MKVSHICDNILKSQDSTFGSLSFSLGLSALSTDLPPCQLSSTYNSTTYSSPIFIYEDQKHNESWIVWTALVVKHTREGTEAFSL